MYIREVGHSLQFFWLCWEKDHTLPHYIFLISLRCFVNKEFAGEVTKYQFIYTTLSLLSYFPCVLPDFHCRKSGFPSCATISVNHTGHVFFNFFSVIFYAFVCTCNVVWCNHFFLLLYYFTEV